MANIYDVNLNDLIELVAKNLKNNEKVNPPIWANYVKTGRHKERMPVRDDWWYLRCASILLKVYRYGPIGVCKLRVKYGGKKNRGYKPERFYKGSGSIIRKALQQLEAATFLKKESESIHKGRRISNEGKSYVDKIAIQLFKGSVKSPHKSEAKKEEPKVKEAAKPKTHEKKEEKKSEPKEIKPEAKKEEPKVDDKNTQVKEKKEEPKQDNKPAQKEVKEETKPKVEVKAEVKSENGKV